MQKHAAVLQLTDGQGRAFILVSRAPCYPATRASLFYAMEKREQLVGAHAVSPFIARTLELVEVIREKRFLLMRYRAASTISVMPSVARLSSRSN